MAHYDATDAHFDRNAQTWRMIDRMFSGEGATRELLRGAFESRRAFEKRRELADWRPYTRDLVSRLSGELFTRAGEITRDTVVSDSYLSRVGPSQESYTVQLMRLADVLVAYDEAIVVMDPAQGLRVVEPQHVPRHTADAITVQGTRDDPNAGIAEDQESVKAWTVYYDDRYEVWVRDTTEDEQEERLVESGRYYDEDPDWSFSAGPPAVRVELPWSVSFGEAVARAHRSLYRLESKYDSALQNSLQGLLQIATGGDDAVKEQIERALKRGAIAIPYDKDHGEHQPVNVGTEGLSPAKDQLERKTRELRKTAYASLEEASQRMTATEVDSRTRSGPVAALSQLAETVQSAEERVLQVVAEAEDARRAQEDLEPDVDWPTDYSHAFDDSDEGLVKDLFGALDLPVDVDTAAEAVAARVKSAGIDPNEDAIREEIRRKRDREAQAESATGGLL
ncbi:structural protein [Salinibacter phage M8CR30-4]|uniref:Structural protein n=2 Tax=Holosalinivirus M8CR302 TaxID=2041855 RepID=A0A2I6UGB8_9CAUD|nr:structural protein [Salinibacter phage M8CR30-2]AUO79034.1 structural protein [Salinibacter phage M8CR30-2]AUO79075.1 structural protein [Salinibacter phage M8CR30-4]